MKISRFTKSVVVFNATVPVILLGWDAFNGMLGANPVNFAIRTTGILALIFLLLSLAVTPISRLANWSWLGQFRRVLGLYAFFHTALHFALFFGFDRAANITDTVSEIVNRPYLFVGSIALIIMVPLAVTSTNGMIKRLGPKRWKMLHRLAYLAAIAGVLHFYMLVKADTTRPIIFASILALLFAYRLLAHYLQLIADSKQLRNSITGSISKPINVPKQWSGQLRVSKIFIETNEVKTFRFVSLTGARLPFESLPGQYLNVTLDIDGRKVRRSYTIASSPTQSGYCEITVKREEKGLASRYLHDAIREGSILQVSAPAGKFTFLGHEANQLVLIAGGVGITPLMSKIRYLTDLGWSNPIHLIVSIKTESDAIFKHELDELQRRFSNLKVTYTLTRATNAAWKCEFGRISPELLKREVPAISQGRVHLCGPTEMTDPIIAMLQAIGVPSEMIKVESFASPSRGTAEGMADPVTPSQFVPNEEATLQFARSGKTISKLEGKTILEIAEDHGINLPYDCRSGICGQCKTRLLSGQVVMDANDALEPVDISNQIILTCQARCQDDVIVDA